MEPSVAILNSTQLEVVLDVEVGVDLDNKRYCAFTTEENG